VRPYFYKQATQEAEVRGLKSEAGPKQKLDPVWKITKGKELGAWLCGRAVTYQAQSSEFKPQYCQKKKREREKAFNRNRINKPHNLFIKSLNCYEVIFQLVLKVEYIGNYSSLIFRWTVRI
jgi:hypothetical protein